MRGKNEPTRPHYLFYGGILRYNSAILAKYKSILKYSYRGQAKFRLEAVDHSQEFGIKSACSTFKISKASSNNTVNFFQRLEQIYPLKQGINKGLRRD